MTWLISSRIATMAVQLASTAILSRLLTAADFGAMSIAFVVIGLTSAIFESAFGLSLIQRQSLDDDFVRMSFWTAMGSALVLTVVIAAGAPVFAGFFRFENLAPLIWVASLTLPMKAVTSTAMGLLQRERRFGQIAGFSVTPALVGNLLVAAPLALNGFGPWSLVIGAVASGFVEMTWSYALTRFPLSLPQNWIGARAAGSTATFYALSQILNYFALSAPSLLIARVLGLSALGLYSRGWRLIDIANGVTASPLQRTLLPTFALMQSDLPRAQKAFTRALGVSTAAFALVSVTGVLLAPAIIHLLLGAHWAGAIVPTQLLFACFLPRAAYKVIDSLVLAFGKARAAAVRQGLYLILMAAGASLGLPYGIDGVAAGVCAAIWLFYATSLVWVARILDTPLGRLLVLNARAVVLALIIGSVGLLMSTLTAHLGLLPSQIATALALAAACLALGWTPKQLLGEDLAWAQTTAVGFLRSARESGLSWLRQRSSKT